jgi:glycosyltransferase involved in cell wall biosynthesis
MPRTGDTAVVIPARNERDRISATVTSAKALPGVDMVVVVDDGSHDGTASAAEEAGAYVVRHTRSRGKGDAMETGAEAVRLLDAANRRAEPRYLLFLDADLGATAANAGPLTEPVRAGTADMTIAVFTNRVKIGGHGFVVRLSAGGIQQATGWQPAQPLNGQRCLTWAAFEAARPLARGFGAETGLTIDLLRRGLRVTEVEVDLAHRATGKDWRAVMHRARQFADVAAALAARRSLVVGKNPGKPGPPAVGGSAASPEARGAPIRPREGERQ